MKLGLTTEVEIVRWRDGDTPIVRISREFPVRLLDVDQKGQFNCAEKNTAKGKEAKKFAEEITKQAKEIILYIPSNNPIKLTEISSFDRILGELYFDGDKVTDILLNNGFGEIK